jgi:hypothetical protein
MKSYGQTFSVTVNVFTTFGGTNISITPYIIQAYKDSVGYLRLVDADTVMSGTTSSMSFVSSGGAGMQYRFKYVAPTGSPNQDSWSGGSDASASGVLSWQDAATFWDSSGTKTPYINVQGFNSIAPGSSSINGTIVEGTGYFKGTDVTAPGNPIGGIIVKGGKNPGGQFFAQTVTDVNGQYSFTNLSNGDYFVMVDAPGYDTTACHYISITGAGSVGGVDYSIGTGGVVPTTLASISELNQEGMNLKLYPNPAKQSVEVSFEVKESSNITLELYSIEGKLIKQLQSIDGFKGIFHSTFALDVKAGNYLIKTKINEKETYSRLVIMP